MKLGFAGLGLMGRPMAANLVRAGFDLTVFNRSAPARDELARLGARPVEDPAELFDVCDVIMLMLANDIAADFVLARNTTAFARRVRGKVIINLGTHAPDWSSRLYADTKGAGGAYVEAPVSGSSGPAKAGQLVAMLAGDPDVLGNVRPLLSPLCRQVVDVGAVPSALRCKLAVNLYLIASVATLAEAYALARGLDVPSGAFNEVIGSGPLGSDVARAKLAKMIEQDFSPQASIVDVCKNADLVLDAATQVGLASELLRVARGQFEAVAASGGSGLDMAAVVSVLDIAANRVGAADERRLGGA